jgi:hypothetical protein
VQGFEGIVASGSIYATDVRFLNDTEEFVHARKLATNLIEKTPEFGQFNFPLRQVLELAVNEIFKSDFLNPNKAHIFVASFTSSDDDLSQWRAYSHGTYGVSIAFDLRAFRPPVESDSAVTFAPCVYQEDEKKELIQHALRHFVSVSQSRWNEAMLRFPKEYGTARQVPDAEQIAKFTDQVFASGDYTAQVEIGLGEARKRIFRLAGLLKHQAFHHEREWRLVLPISPGSDTTNLAHPIRFRSTNASLVPYIEFPLQVPSAPLVPGLAPAMRLPVNDVMLGPGASGDAVSAALEFLRSKSINVVPRRSDVPYRQV